MITKLSLKDATNIWENLTVYKQRSMWSKIREKHPSNKDVSSTEDAWSNLHRKTQIAIKNYLLKQIICETK